MYVKYVHINWDSSKKSLKDGYAMNGLGESVFILLMRRWRLVLYRDKLHILAKYDTHIESYGIVSIDLMFKTSSA